MSITHLSSSISILLKQEGRPDPHEWSWIEMDIGGIPYSYLRAKIMVQHQIDVEGLSYKEVLEDERGEELVEAQMRDGYFVGP
ncbi:MAG: hypothetical protein AAGA85_01305 [Bacteroidota bacterium]